MSKSKSLFIHPALANSYQFQKDHPFHPIRYELTISLLEEIGALNRSDIVEPSPEQLSIAESLLPLGHRLDYIEVVKQLSSSTPDLAYIDIAGQYGLHADETPFFRNMHHAATSIVAGTVMAVEAVVTNQFEHVYHMAGGLHHAFENRASGFCIYNDAVIAIKYIQQKYPIKVLYIDTDVHHGDGVQFSFYSDPNVCTYSIHETGKYLFPGTGYHYEKGHDLGYGTCFNMPLDPYTEDESWLECFQQTLTAIIEHYKPDLIISQHGCDAHALDPLSHLHCSIRIYEQIPHIIHQLAHQFCQGKWVALGGGGYDLWRVVPRAWSHIWLEMTEHPLREQIISSEKSKLPVKWRLYWNTYAGDPIPHYWQDDTNHFEPIPRKLEISEKNRHTASLLIQDIKSI